MTTPTETFTRMVQKIDPQYKLLRAWEMQGGVSAQVTALEVARIDGQTMKMIVRQHGERDRQQHPQVAADEFKLLRLLRAEGMAAPAPYLLDQSGEIFPTPYIVIEFIEGATDLAPAHAPALIPQLATHLSSIHQIDGSRVDVSFLPKQEHAVARKVQERPATIVPSRDEASIRDVLAAAWPIPQHNQSCLLHGDFWPGNVLWKDGRLAAIIDWEDAAFGDPLADVGNGRLEILWAFGSEAMRDFTQCYQALTTIDCTHLPQWDLFAALRLAAFAEWAADEDMVKTMRERYCWFIAQALERGAQ